MMKINNMSVVLTCVFLSSCAVVPLSSDKNIQLLESDSTLINGCKKLGPINIDTRGNPFNFNSVAEAEFKRIAIEKYNADSAVITHRKAMGAGHIFLQGTALKCY